MDIDYDTFLGLKNFFKISLLSVIPLIVCLILSPFTGVGCGELPEGYRETQNPK